MPHSNGTDDGNSSIAYRCINVTTLFMSSVFRWAVPSLAVAGLLGNALILMVLNSARAMKTKPHLLLSAMALVDLVHAMAGMVLNLHLYEDLIDSDSFSRIYHHQLKGAFLTVTNWLAMTSTWLAVAVTVERLIAIRYPLKARFVMRKGIIVSVIILIAVISFFVCSYYWFWLFKFTFKDCSDRRRLVYRISPDPQGNRTLWWFGHIAREIHSILCSLVPVCLLFVFNGLLVYHLHKNQALITKFDDNTHNSRARQRVVTEVSSATANHCYSTNNNTTSNNNSQPHQNKGGGQGSSKPVLVVEQNSNATFRREYKVAMVVLVISLTSACCLLPSAAIVVFDTVRLIMNKTSTPWWYVPAGDINNLLVLSEKVLDFFLYCLTSGYFRRRLAAVLCPPRVRRAPSTPGKLVSKPRWPLAGVMNGATKRMRSERRQSTSTLSTFISSATFRLRRSTASSDGSQRAVQTRLLDAPPIARFTEDGGITLAETQRL